MEQVKHSRMKWTGTALRRVACQDGIDNNRIRFNWGYHDGAYEQKRGSAMGRTRDQVLTQHPDPVYATGYRMGWDDQANDSYIGDSTGAWLRSALVEGWADDNRPGKRPGEQPELKQEAGITDRSIANAQELIRCYGIPDGIKLFIAGAHQEHHVAAFWNDGKDHVFTGFSWGYFGQGPHGLATFAKMIGLPLDIEAIASLPQENMPSVTYAKGVHYNGPAQ